MPRRQRAEADPDPIVGDSETDVEMDGGVDGSVDGGEDLEPRSGQAESTETDSTLPPPPPAVSKFDTQLQRAALDLMPGWVGAFKDAMAKVNHRVPTDDEIAASIIAGAESYREKDAAWVALHP